MNVRCRVTNCVGYNRPEQELTFEEEASRGASLSTIVHITFIILKALSLYCLSFVGFDVGLNV